MMDLKDLIKNVEEWSSIQEHYMSQIPEDKRYLFDDALKGMMNTKTPEELIAAQEENLNRIKKVEEEEKRRASK